MSKTQTILHLIEAKVVTRTVRRFTYRHPFLAEDFAQEAALTIVEDHVRILRADHLDAFLKHIIRQACIDVIRREFHNPIPRKHRPPARRPGSRRRNLQEVLQDLNGREPRPDFLAEVREAMEREEREPSPAEVRSNAPLTDEQRSTLRQVLLGAEGWSRREIAAEFRRRTGRYVSLDRVTDYRKELGLAPASAPAIRRRRFEAGAYDRWDFRVPTVV